VNVGKDSSTLMLHFIPRFDCHGDVNTVVCNSKEDGTWGEEDRKADFPFQQGDKVEVRCQGSVQGPDLMYSWAEGNFSNATMWRRGRYGKGIRQGKSPAAGQLRGLL